MVILACPQIDMVLQIIVHVDLALSSTSLSFHLMTVVSATAGDYY